MAVTGNWTLHYSWGATNNYGQAPITFHTDGTFGGAYTGKWRQQAGTIMLSFDGGPAKYGGTVNGSVGSGAMSTFSGLDGCWYLTAEGTTGILPEAAVGGEVAQPAEADGSMTAAHAEGELVGAGASRGRRPAAKRNDKTS